MKTGEREKVVVAVVRRGDHVLVGRRQAGQTWAGYLEFPGGRLLAGETWEQAARRETFEETGLEVAPESLLEVVHAEYDYGSLEIRFYLARPIAGDHQPRSPFFWLPIRDIRPDDFPPANARLIDRLLRDFRVGDATPPCEPSS